ncbi:MAG: beta-galactosidase [Candidatus Zixiibacteriota bacterium]
MLKVANNKLVIGKESYYPLSAEMHYFRVNKRHWSICFERIRKAGFRIISTCVPWNLHEVGMGDFDFQGTTDHTRDLVVFLELAREFGFKVILNPGPFIDSDWHNSGCPDFLYETSEILARDSCGEPVKGPTDYPSGDRGENEKGYLFSVLHPRFQAHVKRYLAALSDVIKNYIYPKGPVILVRLDNGLAPFLAAESFGCRSQGSGDLSPFKYDYNEYLLNVLFPEYLKNKYGDIKTLSQLYGEKHSDFTSVRPAAEWKIAQPRNLIKYFDWISFKEKVVTDYVLKLKDVYLSFDVPSLFSTDLFLSRDFSLPFDWKGVESEDLFTGIKLSLNHDYVELARHLRYFSTCCAFPWSSEFSVGSRADSPQDGEKYFPVPPQKVKFLLTAALASGIKGFNHYMFVERDHWYDAPLAADGTIRPSFDLIKRFYDLVEKIGLENLGCLPQLGLANYRPYLWYNYLRQGGAAKSGEPFSYLSFLLRKTHKGLSRDFISLKLCFGMPDLWMENSLDGFPVLFVPSAEFMDQETQTRLVKLAKEGKNLLLFGLLPQLDLNMKECHVLGDALKLRTKCEPGVGRVQASDEEMATFLFGHIRGARKSQVLARHEEKPVGAVTRLGKGQVFVFTFDLSAQLCHRKLSFLEQVMARLGVQSQIYCDAPEVDLVFHKNERFTILYLINPGDGISSAGKKDGKKIILRFDPRKLGIKARKLHLTDLLGDEVIKTSAEELKTGVMINIAAQDSRMYLIEAK